MIKGFQGTSLLDFPGRVASLLFFGGCNLTCPFCHNPLLVLEPETCADLDPAEILAELQARQPFIDGVVISGGEPTIAPNLSDVLHRVKDLGLAIKLDSNGLAPQVLQRLLEQQLIDALAIDLKTSLVRYPQLHPHPVDVDALVASVELACAAPIVVEFRTTCVPGWVDAAMIREWGERLHGAPLWALQQYHPGHALDERHRHLEPFAVAKVEALARLAAEYVEQVVVRGL
ncbi:MAG: anaerobic ribonucleoside-triphosphate reductase activating protein [Desulfuromonadales bacterium]|nr:anaerobic ribonucleoside-triphosphate reductase activating protein [Desulfuromonadales bacterium]